MDIYSYLTKQTKPAILSSNLNKLQGNQCLFPLTPDGGATQNNKTESGRRITELQAFLSQSSEALTHTPKFQYKANIRRSFL